MKNATIILISLIVLVMIAIAQASLSLGKGAIESRRQAQTEILEGYGF